MPGDRGSNIAGREIDLKPDQPQPMPSEKSLRALRL